MTIHNHKFQQQSTYKRGPGGADDILNGMMTAKQFNVP
jgi:hypothetical protein